MFSRSITNGNNRHHALVHRRGRPGRPAPLGAARDDKPIHFHVTPLGAGTEGGHGVHRPHGRLGHRQPGGPLGVAGAQKLVPGISDQGILLAAFGFAREDQRLVGYHLQFRHHRFGREGNLRPCCHRRTWARLPSLAPPLMNSSAFEWATDVRPDNDQPMLPEGPIHLVGREPGLRGHLQNIGRLVFAPDGGLRRGSCSWCRARRRTCPARFARPGRLGRWWPHRIPAPGRFGPASNLPAPVRSGLSGGRVAIGWRRKKRVI